MTSASLPVRRRRNVPVPGYESPVFSILSLADRIASPASGLALILSLTLALAVPEPGAAQEERSSSLIVVAGAMNYDLFGSGTAPTLGLQMTGGTVGPLGLEPGIRILRFTSSAGINTTELFPELSVVAATGDDLRPYVAAGAGFAMRVEGGDGSVPTLHAAAGLRWNPSGEWILQPEIRVRSVDPFRDSTVDFTLGVGW